MPIRTARDSRRPQRRAAARVAGALCALLLGSALPGAQAELTLLQVSARSVETPAGAPARELLRGEFRGEVDPRAPANRLITDLDGAPRNARGRVEYRATFALSRPLAATDASGVLVYAVPNRGRGDVPAANATDGHVHVVSGWQGDLDPQPGLQSIEVPVATRRDARPLRSLAFARFVDMPAGSRSLPLRAGLGASTARPLPYSLDTRRARLFRQRAPDAPRERIAARDWAFADCGEVPFPGKPDPTRVCLRDGFDPAMAYGLAYEARDPKVLGLGFAATRDLVAFLRHAQRDAAGHENPVAGLVRWTVGQGDSQSGNFLRSFVHLGFNADEARRRVFDGLNVNIAARQLPLNVRFGLPGGAAGAYEIGSEGTLWWSRYTDRVRGGGTSSLLDRCNADDSCPKVLETFGAAEFWNLRLSPNLVGTDARADIPLPPNLRRYYFPGVTHGGSWRGEFALHGDPAPAGAVACTLPLNPNPSAPTLRALRRALVEWVSRGIEPPPSRYPTLAAGDLVAPEAAAMGWPAIPGVTVPDGKLNTLPDQWLGARFSHADLSGVPGVLPPRLRGTIVQLVPRVDADGNETAGVPSVQLQVPIGTYTGWNERASGFEKGRNCELAGGFVPFARTRAERLASGDPRASLEERYGDHAGFVARVRAAADRQVQDGWLSRADAARILRQAEDSEVLR